MIIGIAIFVSGSSRYKKQPPHGSMISIAAGIFWQGLTSSRKVAEGQHWLEKASTEHGGDYEPADVEGMKYLWKIVPYLMVMIPFWGIYGQTKTAFQIQVSSSICCKFPAQMMQYVNVTLMRLCYPGLSNGFGFGKFPTTSVCHEYFQ